MDVQVNTTTCVSGALHLVIGKMAQYQHSQYANNSQYAMAVTFGRIEEFDGNKEDWSQCEERLGHFFAANGVESAEKKRSIFLSVVGAATYKLLRSLVAPVN